MKIKRFVASSMREAIRLVREEQGADAVILSNRRVEEGIEVVAATDYDAALMQMALPRPEPRKSEPTAAAAAPAKSAPAKRSLFKSEPVKAATLPPAPPPPTTVELPTLASPEVQQLRQELGGMRKMLEQQMAHLAWQEMSERQPERMAALRTMTDLGLDVALSHAIAHELPRDTDPEKARFLPLGLLSRKIPAPTTPDPVLSGGMFALIGPTGVGKTTTIAKLAARFAARHGTRDLALVTTDHYRVGAQEQLFSYGHMLGVPVQTASGAAELARVLKRLSDRKLVLIDTAGMAPRDQKLAAQFAELRVPGVDVRNWLVLSATTQAADQDEIIRRFGDAHPEGCVLTKIDEAARIGGVLSAAIRHRLPIQYFCDGQRVPEDLHPARADQLVLRAMQLARQAPARVLDSTLALQFGAIHAGA
ncbi:flagellar biosynthesis protein FlhF [Sinimarinibacterium sp. NLF-5-8]|uniref:flagellar biosynthesis protein FlhF n=1 Tax=Sinimarinibacterium sp. NLF-5-8 TaxID=2698684 RepID=UPI00137BB95A|nr:flagellar biosynthesis protein FlhF [Sinimarinibacterium sp. NLF-5-8]QHS08709.1 flagellar biosynthesis protein FlhF [Sinimarinibacterium sp. NLF-5-8]